MKRITLYSPTVCNDHSYADAGETLTIGAAGSEITLDRAKELVESGRAASETAARADEAATAK